MRSSLLLLLLCSASTTIAQTAVSLRIDHKAGQEDFGTASSWMTVLGEEVEVDRLEYYLSSFVIVHDGGMETPIDGSYVLADAFVDEALSLIHI